MTLERVEKREMVYNMNGEVEIVEQLIVFLIIQFQFHGLMMYITAINNKLTNDTDN